MTEEQKAHVQHLADVWVEAMERKYSRGVREHGGNIWENDPVWLIEEAIQENIDQFVYLQTALDELKKAAR